MTQDTKQKLYAELQALVDAGVAMIQVKTSEPSRLLLALREHFAMGGTPYHEWSASVGVRTFNTEQYAQHIREGDNASFTEALERPLRALRDPNSEVQTKPKSVHYFCFVDPLPVMGQNPVVMDLLSIYGAALPSTNVVLLFITDFEAMPVAAQAHSMSVEFATPTLAELRVILDEHLEQAKDQLDSSSIDDSQRHQVCQMGLGLSQSEFSSYVALTMVNELGRGATDLTHEALLAGVAEGKTQVVKQSDILELITPEDISNVGGMDRLKEWLMLRADCYSEEAREFGIEPPKGLVLVGIPGSGKSLAAKASASCLGVPLLRLDMGRIFGKYMGESESRLRETLRLVERMAPCVLFVDEVDKGLGGIAGGSSGDSGTSTRVLGTYLTWLQELKAPVFNIVTANRVNGLPPELLRRGRFDQVFSVVYPNPTERKEVLSIHLRRRGHSIDALDEDGVDEYIASSVNYSPAEIESTVKDALILAYSESSELHTRHLLAALRDLIPLYRSAESQISAILSWAESNAVPVSRPEVTKPRPNRIAGLGRTVRSKMER